MQTIFDDLASSGILKTWLKLLDDMHRMGLASLLLVLIVPIVSCHTTFIFTTLTFITVSGMYIAILEHAVPTQDELLSFTDSS